MNAFTDDFKVAVEKPTTQLSMYIYLQNLFFTIYKVIIYFFIISVSIIIGVSFKIGNNVLAINFIVRKVNIKR